MADGDHTDSGGAWVFLSHSHRDFEQVRVVRNALEERGHRPLMFFLKCLDDDTAELPDLIRREIEARTWFLLCDSPHARTSPWVQAELEMIAALPGKVSETVDLGAELDAQLDRIDALSKRATVYLDYVTADQAAADAIRAALEAQDFAVREPRQISEDTPRFLGAEPLLREAVAEGFVLVLLSEASRASEHLVSEAERARHLGGRVEMALLDHEPPPERLQALLAGKRSFDLSTLGFDEAVAHMVEHLKGPPPAS